MLVQDWLGADNELGISIWERKYRNGNESFDEWLDKQLG
jgi:ribonucleoside-diphosphate reductase alpha chain